MDNLQFAHSRKNMVDCQLRPNKVTDERVLTAFETLPREEFVPRNQRAIAYVDDRPENIAAGEARGWRCVQHSDADGTRAAFRSLGLPV